MTDPLNPYAVTSRAEQLSRPIHFGGILTRDDLMMSLRDSPPKRGIARVWYPMLAIVATSLFCAVQMIDGAANQPLPSIAWLGLGLMLLPLWLAVARVLSPAYRNRVRRLETMSRTPTRTTGWLDDECLVISDQTSVMRARWRFFSSPLLFAKHLILPLTTDANHRVVLPFRFFSSVDDLRQVCHFLGARLGFLVHVSLDDQTCVECVSQVDSGATLDVEQARAWTSEQWPFESDSDHQFDASIDLTFAGDSFGFAVKSLLAALLVMLWYFLPIWAAVAGWLVNDYLFFGDWGFIWQRVVSSVIILGPAAFLLCFFVYTAAGAVLQVWQSRSHPVGVRLRTTGVHLSHATFESWFAWSAIAEVITEPNAAGWIAKDSMEQIRFPDAGFDSDESFEDFKAALRSLFAPERQALS